MDCPLPSPRPQEDFFYALLMERSQGEFKLPPREMAYRFCVEVGRWPGVLAWCACCLHDWEMVRRCRATCWLA